MAASDNAERSIVVFVAWPSAPLTELLVRGALETIGGIEMTPVLPPDDHLAGRLVQWATYDCIDHSRTHARGASGILSSSYVFRKALIRKHYLSHTVHAYVVKHPESVLRRAVPRTWELELSFADELEDMWTDELWDLGEAMAQGGARWWILKPGMADRGMGIRLFDSKNALQGIFDGFEEDSDAEDNEEGGDETAVMTSQLRHFVIQVSRISLLCSTRFLYADVDRNTSKRSFCLTLAKCPWTMHWFHRFHLWTTWRDTRCPCTNERKSLVVLRNPIRRSFTYACTVLRLAHCVSTSTHESSRSFHQNRTRHQSSRTTKTPL
jgi:hypothetical protein